MAGPESLNESEAASKWRNGRKRNGSGNDVSGSWHA